MHPWIWLPVLFVQLLAGTYGAAVCIGRRRHFVITGLVSAVAAALPVVVLLVGLVYGGAETKDFLWFLLVAVLFFFVGLLTVFSGWVLVVFYWVSMVLLLGVFMVSGGVFMLFSPLTLVLGYIIYLWHKNLVAAAGSFRVLMRRLGAEE